MRPKPAPPCAVATRDRTLNAAVLRFPRHFYDEIGLRDVAAGVGIDASYVHNCFGSKESLFTEVLAATIQFDRLFASSTSNLLNALQRNSVGLSSSSTGFLARKLTWAGRWAR